MKKCCYHYNCQKLLSNFVFCGVIHEFSSNDSLEFYFNWSFFVQLGWFFLYLEEFYGDAFLLWRGGGDFLYWGGARVMLFWLLSEGTKPLCFLYF